MKKIMLSLILLQLLYMGAVFGEDFFHVYPDVGRDLPADMFYPRGRRFLFTGFSPHRRNLDELKSSGYTALGPVYGRYEEFYESCRKMGMPYLFTVKAEGISLKRLSSKEPLDWGKIEKELREKVRKASSDRLIACWYLQPEELRYWRKNEYRYFQLASKAIRESDPLKRPVWSYLPGHYNRKGLSKYVPYLDFLGKGMYVNYAGQKDSRVWVRYSTEVQAGAISDSGAKAVALSVPEMFQEPEPADLEKISSWVRHDVYASLISGCRGVVIFSLWPRAKFPSWGRYYRSYLQVAAELRELGPVFLFGHECSDLQMKIIAGPQEVSCQVRTGKGNEDMKYVPVSWRNLSYQGRRYLLAANSAEKAVSAEFSGFPSMTLAVRDCGGGKAFLRIAGGKLSLQFAPLEVKLLEFVRTK